MIDTSDIIREILIVEDTGLYDLCGDQVWWMYAESGWKNDSAAVVYQEMSELTHPSATEVITSTWLFKCFGGSDDPNDAKAVFRALSDRFNGVRHQTTTSGTILVANIITSGPYVDAERGYPCWQAQFRVMAQ